MKTKIVCSIGLVGLVSMVLAGGASARSVAAHTGQARVGAQSNCFDANFVTGEVTSTCSADFLVPLTSRGQRAWIGSSKPRRPIVPGLR